MRLYFEWGVRQLNKRGEELCGDSVLVSRRPDSVTLALSDGLGSGVKANILATLTTRIAIHMLENGLPLGEVVQTLSETLPVCRQRNLAYSTFAIAQFFRESPARVVLFDSPDPIVLRHRKLQPVHFEYKTLDGKASHECAIPLEAGDWVTFISDGVVNAGIGGVYPLGWGWEQAARFLERQSHPELPAQALADKVAVAVQDLYVNAPGDDVSIAVVKVRHKLIATVFTGPPISRERDEEVVRRFAERGGKLAICGGTTAKLVSRYMGVPLEVDLGSGTDEVPARARMEGIDVVTEGILTLTQASTMLASGTTREAIKFRADGASELLRLMLGVDHVHFIVGQSVNPAHQNPELPRHLDIRLAVVREMSALLQERNIEATMETT